MDKAWSSSMNVHCLQYVVILYHYGRGGAAWAPFNVNTLWSQLGNKIFEINNQLI
jgi:hypothetical protein